MNRAEHLYEILKERGEVCTFDIWEEMGTAPMRAFNEAKTMRLPVDNARDSNGKKIMRWINGKNYAVYALKRIPYQLTLTDDLCASNGASKQDSRIHHLPETDRALAVG